VIQEIFRKPFASKKVRGADLCVRKSYQLCFNTIHSGYIDSFGNRSNPVCTNTAYHHSRNRYSRSYRLQDIQKKALVVRLDRASKLLTALLAKLESLERLENRGSLTPFNSLWRLDKRIRRAVS